MTKTVIVSGHKGGGDSGLKPKGKISKKPTAATAIKR